MSDSIEKIIADLHPWLPKAISIQFAQRLRSLRQVPEDCVLVPREEQDALLAVVRESTYGSDLGREGRAKVALQNYTDGMQAKTNPAPPTSGSMTTCGHSKYDPCHNCEPTPAQAVAELPELPEPEGSMTWTRSAGICINPEPGYDADQMRAYALEARRGGS